MKLAYSSPKPTRRRRGITLIELAVVILVLLSLISVLFLGATAWKRGSDRAGCILQIRQVQVGVRSFSNFNGYNAGQNISPLNLKTELIGTGRYVEVDPECPARGSYNFGSNEVPEIGMLYMNCSLADGEGHEPDQFADW